MSILYVNSASFDTTIVSSSLLLSGSFIVTGSINITGSFSVNGQGLTGSSGTSGLTGTSGTSGETGTSGTSGETGTSGTSGENGTSGSSGQTGTAGSSGSTGSSGSSGTGFTTITNSVSGRLLVSDGTTSSANAESNLTYSSGRFSVNGNQEITGSLTITQNLTVLGSSSIQYVSSSTLNIEDNIITVNTLSPSIRFGGLSVIDSGSTPQRSGSILFDSINNQWIFVHQNGAGSDVTSSVFIQGPQTFNNLGNEQTITVNRLTKGTGGDLGEHIGDSNITDTGTYVSIDSPTQITGSTSFRGPTNTITSTDITRINSINGTQITGSLNVGGTIAGSNVPLSGMVVLLNSDDTPSVGTGTNNNIKNYLISASDAQKYSKLIFETEANGGNTSAAPCFVNLNLIVSNSSGVGTILKSSIVGASAPNTARVSGSMICKVIVDVSPNYSGGGRVSSSISITGGGTPTGNWEIESLRVYGVT